MITGCAAPSLPSFLPFNFRVCAFSIQRTRLSQSLEQAMDKQERVPFVITYNPALRSISSIIRKHFHILISSPRCYNVFKAAPIVAYKRNSNLSDFLVRAKLRNLTQHNQHQSSYPCGKNCLTCKHISDGQTSYTFYSTGETRPITHYIDCNSKNIIYMIQCNHCSKQ